MTATVTPAMQRKAEALAELVPTFSRGRSKANGQQFIVVPASDGKTAHYSNHLGCTCVGFDKRGVCTHQLAVLLLVQRAEAAIRATTQPPAPKSAEQLHQEQQAAREPRKTYSELFPLCDVPGCREDALRSGRCLEHRERVAA